jgi:hypothetical protein
MSKLEMVKEYIRARNISIDEFAEAIQRKRGYWRRILYKNAPFNDKLEFAIRAAYPDIFSPYVSNKPARREE